VLVIVGCEARLQHPTVTGKVTLDGEPLPNAVVSFMPVDEQGSPTLAVTDRRGAYTLEQTADVPGAPAGKYTVRITTYREGRPEADPPVAGAAEKVPAHYNIRSTLTAEVRPGENVVDFELSSEGEIIQPPADR
jgi:hypothetical protein